MTTNIAEVLKLAAKLVQYDIDERTWLEFRFKHENYLTLVDEKYVQLLHDAKSQPVANVPAGGDETAVTIRTLSHTLHALLATVTTRRRLRMVPNRNGFEVRRRLVAKNAPKTAGRRFAMLQDVLQSEMSDNPAKFEETWKSWLCEARQKLRDHLLVNLQQFESGFNKLKAIMQAYLKTNKTWIANVLRESDPVEVDHISKGKSKGKGKTKSRSNSKVNRKRGNKGNSKGEGKSKNRDRSQSKGKGKSKSKGKGKRQ